MMLAQASAAFCVQKGEQVDAAALQDLIRAAVAFDVERLNLKVKPSPRRASQRVGKLYLVPLPDLFSEGEELWHLAEAHAVEQQAATLVPKDETGGTRLRI